MFTYDDWKNLPVGERVSPELTEIRTVHSRAKTALRAVEGRLKRDRIAVVQGQQTISDPDAAIIADVLRQVVALTALYARQKTK